MLPTDGRISFSDVNTEEGKDGHPISMAGASVAVSGTLFGDANEDIDKNGPFSMSEFKGYSHGEQYYIKATRSIEVMDSSAQSFYITVRSDMDWSLTHDIGDQLLVEKYSGSGDDALTFAIMANRNTTTRTGTIVFKTENVPENVPTRYFFFTVKQFGVDEKNSDYVAPIN